MYPEEECEDSNFILLDSCFSNFKEVIFTSKNKMKKMIDIYNYMDLAKVYVEIILILFQKLKNVLSLKILILLANNVVFHLYFLIKFSEYHSIIFIFGSFLYDG